MDLSETDKAYLAGLVDGEGCLHIAKQTSKRTPTPIYFFSLTVSSTDFELLEYWRVKTEYGGIQTLKRKNKKWQTGYNWQIRSNQAIAILKNIYPYLMIKKEQADIAFLFQNTFHKSWGGKGVGCVRGGKRVNSEILYMREKYRKLLSEMKGIKTKVGRPKIKDDFYEPVVAMKQQMAFDLNLTEM